jgi:hypothetical protein
VTSSPFGIPIDYVTLHEMPREWRAALRRVLEMRGALKEHFRVHYFESLAEFSRCADLAKDIDDGLRELLLVVADAPATVN